MGQSILSSRSARLVSSLRSYWWHSIPALKKETWLPVIAATVFRRACGMLGLGGIGRWGRLGRRRGVCGLGDGFVEDGADGLHAI